VNSPWTRSSVRNSSREGPVQVLLNRLFAPVDISFLILFRILFSAAMLWTVWELFTHDNIAADYLIPGFHFTYHGFSWLKPWGGEGMYVHCAALGVLAFFMGLGFLYRTSAVLLFLGFTYVFLLDKALYLNHHYLLCLLSLMMVFMPANRRLAVDSLLRPSLRTDVVPAWTLWLLRFQIGLPYVLGGVAKLKSDWLRGQPMHSWLPMCPLRYLLGPVVEEPWMALLFSWGGALFDISIVPLLLWPRTRKIAFCAAVVFHMANAFLFDIGVFPWLMIGATFVFFPPDWPRRLWRSESATESSELAKSGPPTATKRLIGTALLLYVTISVLMPFRHLLYPGNVLWTEEGHLFAWNMMLRTKVTGVQVLAASPASQSLEYVDIMQWLTRRQLEELSHDPEMMREFAGFVREQYEKADRDDVEIHVVAISSLNGRKPQLLVDPTVDLSRVARTLRPKPWIVPLTEPFRWEPWKVPMDEWQKHIDLRGTKVTHGRERTR
jgi:vitamin K-dependent gamma-carboxylase